MLTVIPPTELVLLLSSSSSFTGDTVTRPCLQSKRQAENQEAALPAPSHSSLATRPGCLSTLVLLGAEGHKLVSSAKGWVGFCPPRLPAVPSYSAKAADSYTVIYLFGC